MENYDKWLERNERKMNTRALQRDHANHISRKCREDIHKFLNIMMLESPITMGHDPMELSRTFEFLLKNKVFVHKVLHYADQILQRHSIQKIPSSMIEEAQNLVVIEDVLDE